MEIRYRSALQADEPILLEMLHAAIHVPPGEPAPPREIVREPDLSRYVEDWGREGDLGILAIRASDDVVVGAAWLRRWTEENHGYGFVAEATPELSMSVLPGYRSQGIGRTLLAEILKAAGEQYAAVSLSVALENPARRLYERAGFRVLRTDKTSLVLQLVLGSKDRPCP